MGRLGSSSAVHRFSGGFLSSLPKSGDGFLSRGWCLLPAACLACLGFASEPDGCTPEPGDCWHGSQRVCVLQAAPGAGGTRAPEVPVPARWLGMLEPEGRRWVSPQGWERTVMWGQGHVLSVETWAVRLPAFCIKGDSRGSMPTRQPWPFPTPGGRGATGAVLCLCSGSLCLSSSVSSSGQHLRASMGCLSAACWLSCPFPRAAMLLHHWGVASPSGCCAASFIGMLLGWMFRGCWWLRTARASSLSWGLLQSQPGGSWLPFHVPLGFG